jgi:DNA polymerase sigma
MIEICARKAFANDDLSSLSVEVYGSNSHGLALDSSDVDLCITGINCFNEKSVEKQKIM